MPITVSIKYDDKEIKRYFNKVEKGLRDFKEPLGDSADELIKEFYGDKVFETEGAAVGKKWSPLKARTLQARARGYGHYAKSPITTGRVMIWTGALKKGFKKTVSSFKAVIENKVKYFKYANNKRPVFGINKEVMSIVEKNFEKYFKKILK